MQAIGQTVGTPFREHLGTRREDLAFLPRGEKTPKLRLCQTAIPEKMPRLYDPLV